MTTRSLWLTALGLSPVVFVAALMTVDTSPFVTDAFRLRCTGEGDFTYCPEQKQVLGGVVKASPGPGPAPLHAGRRHHPGCDRCDCNHLPWRTGADLRPTPPRCHRHAVPRVHHVITGIGDSRVRARGHHPDRTAVLTSSRRGPVDDIGLLCHPPVRARCPVGAGDRECGGRHRTTTPVTRRQTELAQGAIGRARRVISPCPPSHHSCNANRPSLRVERRFALHV